MTPPDKADWTRKWVGYAKSDLAAAHKLLESDERHSPRLLAHPTVSRKGNQGGFDR